MLGWFIGYFKGEQAEAERQIPAARAAQQAALIRNLRLSGALSVRAVDDDELVYTVVNYKAAKALGDRLYTGTNVVSLAPIPGTDHWEVRLSE